MSWTIHGDKCNDHAKKYSNAHLRHSAFNIPDRNKGFQAQKRMKLIERQREQDKNGHSDETPTGLSNEEKQYSVVEHDTGLFALYGINKERTLHVILRSKILARSQWCVITGA